MIIFETIMYALVFLGFIGCGILMYKKEKRDWNNGVCPKCGSRLSKIGGYNKGYMCESCREHWVWFTMFKPKEQ